MVYACGLVADGNQPYRPHLTLSRKVLRPVSGADPQPICWNISDFCLVHSVTRDSGAEYRILQRWELTADPGEHGSR